MAQTHRLQVSPARAGIVLTTKQHISELAKQTSKLDFALLIPTVDGTKPSMLHHGVEGPFEITVEDFLSKSVYKRLALMVTLQGTLSYKLPEPKRKLQTAAVTEIVLELDSRLLGKSEFEKMKQQPAQTFRSLLATLIPSLDIAASSALLGIRPVTSKISNSSACSRHLSPSELSFWRSPGRLRCLRGISLTTPMNLMTPPSCQGSGMSAPTISMT